VAYLQKTGGWEQREQARLQSELDELLRQALVRRWRDTVPEAHYTQVLQRLLDRQISPWQAVAELVNGGEA